MSYKDVFDVFKRERKLGDDETALLTALKRMTIPEREALRDILVETLGPPAKVKTAKPATKKFKKCDVCGVSKRAAHHRDVDHPDYHEFNEGGPRTTGKSARASSLAEKIQGTASGVTFVGKYPGDEEDGSCGKCGEDGDNNVHHKRTDPDYHPFVPAASSADESLSPRSESSKGAQSSPVSSEAETASASTATGG